MYEKMELGEEPELLCDMLVEVFKRKFDYEINPKQVDKNDLPISIQNDANNIAYIKRPVILTPKSAIHYFQKNFFLNQEELEIEIEEGKLTKEMVAFTKLVAEKEFIMNCKSTKQFWL
jgi:hypothetical protein